MSSGVSGVLAQGLWMQEREFHHFAGFRLWKLLWAARNRTCDMEQILAYGATPLPAGGYA